MYNANQLGVETKLNAKAVKSNSDPDWGARLSHKDRCVSTGVCLNGFFVSVNVSMRSFAPEVYRVLGWHEGSVGSRKA